MKKLYALPLAVLLSTLFNAVAYAKDGYVSDELFVPLRSGMGTKYRITHRGLPSGTKLKIIEEHIEEGWTLVETPKGEQGWIRNQYLLHQPIAKLKLASAVQKITKLEKQNNTLRQEVGNLQKQNTRLKSELSSSLDSSQKLEKDLKYVKTISAGSIDLHTQHQALMEKHQLLQTKADVLKAETERLQADVTYKEWLYGACILLLGMIATMITQSISKRKRYSEWG